MKILILIVALSCIGCSEEKCEDGVIYRKNIAGETWIVNGDGKCTE